MSGLMTDYLHGVNDFLGSQNGHSSSSNSDFNVLKHQELHALLGLHQGGDENVPRLLRPPVQEVHREVPG